MTARQEDAQPTLREWLETSEFQGSVRKLAEALGVPLKTAQDWVYGRRVPSPENLAKLAGLTGIARFAPPPPDRALRAKQLEEAEERIARTKALLVELSEHLEYFRLRSPAARELLRRELSGNFAASVGTLLQLLFDEERLKDWQGTLRLLKGRR